MKNEFIDCIRGVIPKKNEGIEDLTDKVVFFLNNLKKIDETLFSYWYEQGKSKKQALENEVMFNKESLSKIIKKEWDKKFPELGSSFIFWSGKVDDMDNCQVSFSIGSISENKYINNRVVVKFPKTKELQVNKNDERITKIEKLIKQVWDSKEIEINYL